MTREALVIVEEAQTEDALSLAAQHVQVTQALPPRLAIVSGTDAQIEAVRGVKGVVAVCEGAVPDALLQGMTPTERTFADAWALRGTPKKARLGEGLAWDAEGFQPPDRPKRGPQS
jgi:hypothetical protein